MLPAQRKKVNMETMTEEEKKLFRLYGKLPTHKNVLTKVQKDRKFFDSGDYALSKAGVTTAGPVGTAIPSPENIPHATPSPSLSTSAAGAPPPINSPIRESPLVPHNQPILDPAALAEPKRTTPSSLRTDVTNEDAPVGEAEQGVVVTAVDSEDKMDEDKKDDAVPVPTPASSAA